MEAHNNKKLEVIPVNKEKVKHIWKVTLYLFLITAGEFAIAFTLPVSGIKNAVFIIMTLVKAYYIIYEFMHLGGEVKGLRLSILTPMTLVVWLIVALMIQGEAIYLTLFGG